MDVEQELILVSVIGTVIVAVTGVIGPIAAPLVAERARRKSARDELLRTRTLTLYIDLLEATETSKHQAETLTRDPRADLPPNTSIDLNKLVSQARVLASDAVFKELQTFAVVASDFAHLWKDYDSGPWTDDARRAFDQGAREMSHALRRSFLRMHSLVRTEMNGTRKPRRRWSWSIPQLARERATGTTPEPESSA